MTHRGLVSTRGHETPHLGTRIGVNGLTRAGPSNARLQPELQPIRNQTHQRRAERIIVDLGTNAEAAQLADSFPVLFSMLRGFAATVLMGHVLTSTQSEDDVATM